MAISHGARKGLTARITSQGQITVPKVVRDELGAKPGDELTFEATADGFVVRHRPRINILDFAGLANTPPNRIPGTAEALDEAIERGQTTRAADEHRRVIRGGDRRGRRQRP